MNKIRWIISGWLDGAGRWLMRVAEKVEPPIQGELSDLIKDINPSPTPFYDYVNLTHEGD